VGNRQHEDEKVFSIPKYWRISL